MTGAAGETVTQALHRLTSYDTDWDWGVIADDPRIRSDYDENDLSRVPWSYKRYDSSLPRLALPRGLPTTDLPAMRVLAGSPPVPPRPWTLPWLGRALFLCSGVVRVLQRPAATYLMRAAGSAGGRFPLEVYVAVPAGSAELPAGVHWYDPEQHALVTVGSPPTGETPAVVVTGVPWRTGWRYRERGYRHIYWDAGTLLSQFLAAAASAGSPAVLRTRFPDEEVDALVGADGVQEISVAVVSLGLGEPAVSAAGSAAHAPVDADPLELPLDVAAQRAGAMTTWGEPWPAGGPIAVPVDGPSDDSAAGEPVEAVVLRRGSGRRMYPDRSLPRSLLESSMAAALRGVDIPHWVVVHAVDGMAPGLYRWPDLSTPVRAESMRDELFRVCLDQGLGRDACFVVVAATRVADLDDRQYREAQLGAGLVEGRLHLAAYAQGAAATGMTFADSEIPGLLGGPWDGLLLTCVGVVEYRSKRAGSPGAPVEVRLPEMR